MNKAELIAFEDEIAELFNAAKIFSPVHLYFGNEDNIEDIKWAIKKILNLIITTSKTNSS
mgnify:CR=1 FL=1